MGILSADQIRVFLTIVDKGSFSAAARTLRRSQTAVSYAILNLEQQLGITLFDRVGKRPILTAEGAALISDARKVTHSIQHLRVRAEAVAQGIESEIALAIDAFYPPQRLVEPLRDFAAAFPQVELLLHQEMIGTTLEMVDNGRCLLGLVSQPMSMRAGLQQEPIIGPKLKIVAVAAADHPLAEIGGPILSEHLLEHKQVVAMLNAPIDFGNLSPRQWRCSNMGTLCSAVLAGVGWSAVPIELVEDDIAAGRLSILNISAWQGDSGELAMSMVHLSDAVLGPAAQWLMNRICNRSW